VKYRHVCLFIGLGDDYKMPYIRLRVMTMTAVTRLAINECPVHGCNTGWNSIKKKLLMMSGKRFSKLEFKIIHLF